MTKMLGVGIAGKAPELLAAPRKKLGCGGWLYALFCHEIASRYCRSCINVGMRLVAGIVVVKMRSSVLSLRRQMTSSRQSPRMSPLSPGVDLEPLLELQPCADAPLDVGSRS